ncbi:MAG TPA: bifunctional methylenetetrahydrofolate dehydrogenase/methenyltetrahydrofolate cyclohydrolase FolD [Candidatus Coproplasma stercoripullorum]|uniref:Bifunctional protein FolD n=1 Tax=Candidatus Coproplasma stercoripullorum TaxID=2840751 RepID=A0A9D1AGS2_9FIRM|nr:bifunctional methylenetetrahydrofolate dehydrogenase/methenyltetrahydrofolate cyclohydrolase FolD [Candidatus Coproplasma stercoripullorum]
MYKIIDGKKLAHAMRADIREKIAAYKESAGREIGLAVVLVGEDPASQVYVRNKIKACEEVGIKSFAYYLDKDTAQARVEELIKSLAVDNKINGILVQLPLPSHLDAKKILELIPYSKDVDGFSAENTGKLSMNEPCLVACTPNGVMKMFESEDISLSGKSAVVIGRSNIVGKPMAMLLTNADATVTLCHSKTKNLKEICASADIIVAAAGKAKFVTADMVKDGAVVIDVGMDRDESGKLCGDVDFENVKEKCSYITPVPGGVGPMTITMLMYNTYLSAARS